MKREELIAYDKWLTRRKWGTGEIISPEKAADLYLAEHPLPPAEGAEEILDKYPHSTEYPSFIHENSAIAAMHEFATLHAQKIADKIAMDNCEVFVKDWAGHDGDSDRTIIVKQGTLEEYISLVVHQLADKMVEERIILDEEMAEPVQDALYATGRFTIDECNVLTEGILMYIKERGIINLKSRESHG